MAADTSATTYLVPALAGLGAALLLALLAWLVSLRRNDVSIADAAWPFLVLLPALVFALQTPPGRRRWLVLALAAAWALRLSTHILWRHRGQPEDRRYQAIRRRNDPGFRWKSAYLVFGLQALLAWLVALPLLAAVQGAAPWSLADLAGAGLVLLGLGIESLADLQLGRFRAAADNRGQTMQSGLWRYSRHPNYFGECLLWWGFWLLALGAGGWWSLISPLLVTLLLLKVSGVTLLERDLVALRPSYADYMRRTSAFLPWRPRA